MVKIQAITDQSDPSRFEYVAESKNISSIMRKHGFNLYRTPTDRLVSAEELLAARKVNVDFNTIIEGWNIYRLNDGTRIKTKLVTANIRRLLDYYDTTVCLVIILNQL